MGRATTTFITGGVRTIGRRGGTTIIHAEDPSLVLDLQFARDAAYVSRRGPLPTFTRASQAWRINSAGVIVPAAINEARIDYDPTTLACLGLAIEEQRTNLFTWSGDFMNAAWFTGYTKTGGFTAPDGTPSAVQFSGATASTSSRQILAYPSTVIVCSVFFKNVSRTSGGALSLLLRNDTTGVNLSPASFDVSSGVLFAPMGNWSVKAYPNGWYRVSVTQTTGITPGDNLRFYYGSSGVTLDLGAFLVWGGQAETGSFLTSYIPTTSFAFVRSADVCSITGGAFTGFYNQSEGTLVFRGVKQALAAAAANPAYLGVDDGTAGNRIITYGGTAETGQIKVGGVNQASLGGVTQAAALTPFAIAVRYKANDFAFCLNGGTVSTDVSGTVPTVTQMLLGIRLATEYMGGWIQSVQYYNRIKTNAQLQTLSTP